MIGLYLDETFVPFTGSIEDAFAQGFTAGRIKHNVNQCSYFNNNKNKRQMTRSYLFGNDVQNNQGDTDKHTHVV